MTKVIYKEERVWGEGLTILGGGVGQKFVMEKYSSRNRKLRARFCKHRSERITWKWHKSVDSQSPAPLT